MVACTWKCEYQYYSIVVEVLVSASYVVINYISWLKFHCNFCALLAMKFQGFLNLLWMSAFLKFIDVKISEIAVRTSCKLNLLLVTQV